MADGPTRRLLASAPSRWKTLLKRPYRMAVRVRAITRFGLASLFTPSTNMAREAAAVAAGRDRFRKTFGATGSTNYTLRRNTHRIEKGIVSRPRRAVFATGYIEETVEHYARELRDHAGEVESGSELAWARDVLAEYFSIVGSNAEIDRARARFGEEEESHSLSEPPLVPYRRDLGTSPPVSYEAMKALAVRRRSVRWFENRPVPRDLIDAAVEIAGQSPSACNRQPFTFYVYDSPDDVQRIAAIPGGTVGFAHNFPVIVAVVGSLDAFFSDRDRHLIYIDGALAAMSFMLALETLGLSSCAINTPGEESFEDEAAAELGLAPYERPVMFIALGYPDATGMVPRSQKKALENLRRYNP